MSDEAKFPSQLAERFQVRMPDGLRDHLRDEAEKNGRSMNAEIVHRLEGRHDWSYLRERTLRDLGQSAEENDNSLAEEIAARLEWSLSFPNEWFHRNYDLGAAAHMLSTEGRLGSLEGQVGHILTLVRKLAGEPEQSTPQSDNAETGTL